MAKRDRILTVKVATEKAIIALKGRLDQLETDYKAQAAKEVAFQKAHAAWKKTLMLAARKALTEAIKDEHKIDAWLRSGETDACSLYARCDIKVGVKKNELQPEPVRDWEPMHEHTYNRTVEEIKQAIRILRMTDQPTVPASTFAALSRYL